MAKKPCKPTGTVKPFGTTRTVNGHIEMMTICPYCHRNNEVFDVGCGVVTRCLNCGEKYRVSSSGASSKY